MPTEQGAKKRGKPKLSPQQISERFAIEERRNKVADLKVNKAWSVRQIAKELGVGVGTVQRDIEAVFARTREFANASIRAERAISLARLETATAAILPSLVEADEQTLDAIDRFVKIDARKAKLLGLEAPTQHVILGVEQGLAKFFSVAKRVLSAEDFQRLAAAILEEGGEPGVAEDSDGESAVH